MARLFRPEPVHQPDGMRLDINRAGVGLLPRARHPRASSLVSQPRCSEVLHGGRTWWAHFEFTRINIAPTILAKRSRISVRNANARPAAGLINLAACEVSPLPVRI